MTERTRPDTDFSLSYNADGHIQRVTQTNSANNNANSNNDQLIASYQYNPRRERIQKTLANGRTERYFYGLNQELLKRERYGTNNQLLDTRYYLWLNHTPLAVIDIKANSNTPSITHIHSDHLGTPRAASNSAGQIIWQWHSDPFGNTPPHQDPDGDGNGNEFELNLRFPGQYYDQETGLHYNLNRYYNPKTGRYLEADPIGLHGGWNLYSYAKQNPINYFDLFGLEVRFICRPLAGVASITGKQHCFVRVSCPEEGWATTLSLFGTNPNWLGIPQTGRKGRNDPRDNAGSSNNTFDQPVDPGTCPTKTCAFEKAVLKRYQSFPTEDVPYDIFGPNSNSFAQDLATGTPEFPTTLPPGAPSNDTAPGINMSHPNFP